MNDLPSDWVAKTAPTPPTTPLPGAGVTGTPSEPPPGSTPLTAEQKARAAVVDAEWVTLALPRSLAQVLADAILFMQSHPELAEWANKYGANISYVSRKP